MEKKNMEEVKITYSKSKDFRTVAATGAWGGATPQGEILCTFFIERQQIPEISKLYIDKNTGKVSEDTQNDKQFEREVQVSVVMRADIARNIGEWLVTASDSVLFKGTKTEIS